MDCCDNFVRCSIFLSYLGIVTTRVESNSIILASSHKIFFSIEVMGYVVLTGHVMQ